MTGVLQQLLDFAAAHPSVVGVIVLLSAAAEAIVVVGAVIPGTSIVLALAGVAGAAHADIWLLTLWAATGAVIGDGVSFWIGHRYGDHLRQIWPFSRRPGLLDRGAAFFDRHGGKSVFIARFLPGVRAVVPVAAGMLGVTVARFYAANVTSAVVWAVSHVLPAAGVGVAFATLGKMSGRLALLLGFGLAAVLVLYWLVRLVVRRLAPAAVHAYEGAVARLGERPDALSRRLAAALDPSQPGLPAMALWSMVLVLASVGFLGVLEDLVAGDPLVRADVALNHLVQSIRTHFADAAMAAITSLGDTVVTGGLALLVIAWLAWRRAIATAGAVALTMGVAAAFVFAMKAILHKPRPIEIYSGADAFSFPSGHTTLATVLYGSVAVLVAKSLPRPAQIAVFTIAASLAGAIGLSRIYLSAHWPSDVLGGILFGASLTAAFALIFERLPAERIGRAGLAAVVMTAFVGLGTWHATSSFQKNLSRYAQKPVRESFSLTHWLGGTWQNLPAFRTDLAGEREEPTVLQWAGSANRLASALLDDGWRIARPWSAKDTLQFLNPGATIESLPPLPLLNDGRFPVLTMNRSVRSHDNQRLVIRAWPTQIDVVENNTKAALLVVSITLEEITHPFRLISTLREYKPPSSAGSTLDSALRADPAVVMIAPNMPGAYPGPLLAYPNAVPFAPPGPLDQKKSNPLPAQAAPPAPDVRR